MSNSTTDLGKESIGRLLLKLATPSIIAQLVNVLYNIVDRIFIGRMQNGDVAMAGIGVAFPIVLLVSAFAAFVGMGGAPLAAIKMGEKDNNEAEKIMTNSFSVLLIIAGILTVIFMIFKEPILWKFGASESTVKYATDYLGYRNCICANSTRNEPICKYTRICKNRNDDCYYRSNNKYNS